MASRTEMIGNKNITDNYYKNYSQKSENAEDFGALLQAGCGREEQLKAARGQEKDTQASKAGDKGTEEKTEEPKSYREQILEKMEEMAQNIKNGTIQPKFQIGAQEYTIKEWEKLLADFDDAEETLREEVEAQIEELKKQAEIEAMRREMESGMSASENTTYVSENATTAATENTAETTIGVDAATLLTDEVTKCSYPTDDPKHKHWYITAYGQDGISCKEAYYDGTRWINKDLWSFSYTEEGQYEKVMAFLERFPQDANLRFAAHENFWQDFLAGEIDEDDFVNFFETSTKDGVPYYFYEKDGSTYIDREKIKYAKYMNSFGAQFYTAEEMELMHSEMIREKKSTAFKQTVTVN